MELGNYSGLAEYVVDANQALNFRFVGSAEDMENEKLVFQPEMVHQIYGDNENIFGYKDLKIDLMMSRGTLRTFIQYSFSSKVDPAKTDGVTPDDVVGPLLKILAPGSATENKEEFVKQLSSAKETGFRPIGDLVHSFSSDDKTYEVYSCTESTPGFRSYHDRLQVWIMFYIDAASYIDIDDDNWKFFLLYQKRESSGEGCNYSICGYITVYEYYAYGRQTNKKRPRISQMLILPQYQRQGLGAALLNTLYRNYLNDSSVVDITVEDPSDNFIRLRDFVDTQNCLKNPAFSKENVMNGFTDSLAESAAKELKLCRKQARRIYEIVRLHYTPLSDTAAYKSYRVDVKRRLNAPYQREQSQLEKLRRALKPEEFAAAMVNITDREQRLELLEKQFTELEAHYKKILEKVAATV
ncbi:histone acetyltransferase type B catalytic subunit [Eurytemora carolleeae]|uniref:histone acetyltransferase type B catalytic subunit n=1 Tax=Eurytemora carolleeae TaxID=1294199 RepID=UPI000C7940D7|nr:histone acetyltransferase type B catalytic subunit [Eurytemora carolleeae]|eukprot:XP_023348942.1 histone acetyltransferase type B catalytic subunit-like [Eurytemora affinis]